MAKQSFVQLAHTFKPNKDSLSGWYASPKLDGCRVIYDGGATRGLPKEDVPWANMAKDVTPGQISTGLWSRYGNIIHAPDWWLDKLPPCPLDGEGWIGPKSWEETSSIMSKLPKNRDPSRWREVKFKAFNIAPPEQLFKPRIIDETNFKKVIGPGVLAWWQSRFDALPGSFLPKGRTFHTIYTYMKLRIPQNDVISIHEQTELSLVETEARATVAKMMEEVLGAGGEGLIIRRGSDTWIPERSHNLLKLKPWEDAEAKVIGYTTGDLTELGSKFLGMMGACICRLPNGKTFKVSGFTNEERYFEGEEARDWAIENPDSEVPEWVNNPKFPRGSVLTYKFRELTNDEIPKEARFLRKPNPRV